jgi:uncharacterized repeat protein (TIGR03806 family)
MSPRRAVALLFVAAFAACGQDELFKQPPDEGTPTAAATATTPGTSPSHDSGTPDAGPVKSDFGLDTRPATTTCHAPARPPPPADIVLTRVYPDLKLLDSPMMLQQAPGDRSRWFAPMVQGNIVSFPATGSPTAATIVGNVSTLSGIPILLNGDSILFDFAFHPKFQTNGRLYLSWTSSDGPTGLRSRIGYITSTNGGTSFTSYTDVLVYDEPGIYYHHGSAIKFAADGLLYMSIGDGGDSKHGTLTTTMNCKLLRIDVDNIPAGQTYGIPPDNPFAKGGGEPAAYAYGFRNPFRFSFDRGTGDIWLADVGAALWEEVDIVKRGGFYGWACREGKHDYTFEFDPACAAAKPYALDPIFDYPHNTTVGNAIIGGVVYRGSQIPSLVGAYLYGDNSTGEIFTLRFDPTTGAPVTTLINPSGPFVSIGAFGEDPDGEVFAVDLNEKIYAITAAPVDGGAPPATFPSRLSETGCDPRAAKGLVPYGVNAPQYADGATIDRWLALPDGGQITVGTDGDFDLPKGSVLVETFSSGGKRIETRLLVRHDDGNWAGYSYEWNDDQTDAVLLPSSKRKNNWSFPSRSDCVSCHTDAAGRTLGLELGQLNRDFVYPSTNRISNQLRTFEHIGLFSAPLGKGVDQIVAYADPSSTTAAADARARSYLHANCSMCHRPPDSMDLRYGTAFVDTKTCNVDATTGDLGVGAKLIVPGDPTKSHLSVRPHATDWKRMPPLASNVVDTSGTAVIDAWITSLTACP